MRNHLHAGLCGGKKFSMVLAGAAILAVGLPAVTAHAQMYDFTFTDGGYDATGTIDVVGGVAVGGSINVTGIPLAASPSTFITASASLIPGSGAAQNHNGDNLPYDNLVNFANNPILTGNGIDFGADQYDPTHYSTLIGLWGGDANGNPVPNEYTLFVGEAQLDGNGNVIPGENGYVYTYAPGTLTIVPDLGSPVPEPASLVLVGLGAAGLLARRRRA